MAGPGGDEVGRVSIRVVPNTDGFKSQLKSELAGIEKSVKIDVPVVADTSRLAAEVRAAVASISGLEATIKVRADTSGALAEAEAVRRLIESMKADIKVGAKGMVGGSLGDIFKGLFTAGAALPGLFGSIAGGLSGIFTNGMKVFSVATGLIGKFTSLGKVATGLAGGIAGGVAAAVTAYFSMVKLGAQASKLLLIIGAVTYAVGALGAVVSGLPALLFGVGLAAGTVALGMDGIKRAYESNLKPALDELKSQVSATFEQAMAPAMQEIARILPELTSGFKYTALAVSGMVSELVGIFTSAEGVKMLNRALFNSTEFIDALTPGVKSMITEMLKTAQVTGAFRLMGEIIGLVAQKVGDLFRRFSEGGESSLMVRALEQLKLTLGTVLDVFNDLIVEATDFFTRASPGVRDGLDSIRRVIGKIDFGHLGESFGIFARAVGGFFDSIPQTTWDGLVNAVRDLALKFKELAEDPNVQGFFNGLVFLIPMAITAFTSFLGVIRSVINFFAWLKDAAIRAYESITNGLLGLVSIMSISWTLIKTTVEAKLTEIVGAVQLKWAEIKAAISAKITEILGAVQLKWAEIKNAISTKITEILGAVQLKWAEIKAAVSNKISQILADVRAKWEQIKSAVRDKVNAAKNAVRDGWSQIVNTVRDKVSDVVSTARELPGKIKGALGNLGDLLLSAGKSLIAGLLRGIKQGVADALAYARTIASRIAAVKGPLPKDRKELIPAGLALIDGLLIGLRTAMAPVLAYAGGIAAQVVAALSAHTTTYVHAGQSIGAQVGDGVVTALSDRLRTGIPAALAEAARVHEAASSGDPWAAPGTVYEDGSVRGGPPIPGSRAWHDSMASAVASGLEGAQLRMHPDNTVTIARAARRGDRVLARR